MVKITCIVCPMGCQLEVNKVDGEYQVTGNTCKRGAKYGVEELTDSKRVLTTTVKLKGSYLNLLPVKTADSIQKNMIFDGMEYRDNIEKKAPINVGDVIVENVLGTGVDIISAKCV